MIYRRMYPKALRSPLSYMSFSKIHKAGVPLRPMASSRGTVANKKAKEMARNLTPLVQRSQHHVLNTKDFAQQIKSIMLHQNECIMSYNVKALFTSVPIVPAIKIVRDQLE